ncbi:hypothetical protein E4U13_007485 [Claviceps humidiphila]|uniref:Uncharacterized protein n=1 Tax=Claviceps humidiphila TaxID=1294629 RepID=A0A9P7TWQ2_9HYPO|nr:hypothetical protein E4U13_007485 [Claviceps humidiphila]
MASTMGLRCLCTSSERTNPSWRGESENRPSCAAPPPTFKSAGRGAKVGRTRGSRIDRLMDIRMNKALCGTQSGFKNQERPDFAAGGYEQVALASHPLPAAL